MSDQPDLFEWHKLARRDDPATSKDAAIKAALVVSRHEGLIVEALRRAGQPLACEQIADMLVGMDAVQVARRMKGLEGKGVVKRTGLVHPTKSGRWAAKWRLA